MMAHVRCLTNKQTARVIN